MHHRALVYLVCWLAVVSAGVAATLFSVYLPLIAADMAGGVATPDVVGRTGSFAGSAFLIGWAIGAFALGAMGDRIGRRMALFASVLMCSVGIVATAFAPSLPILVAIRFLTGAGAGSILLMCAVLVAEMWATGDRARMVGIMMNAFPVGLIVSGVIAGNVTEWRTAYLIGGSTLLLAGAVLAVVRESEWWLRSEKRVDDGRGHALRQLVGEEHRRDLLVGITLFGAMLVGLWAVFVWMPTWVHTMSAPEVAQRNRGVVNVMLGAGSLVGGLIAGPLSNGVGRRTAAAVGYLGCIILTAVTFRTGLGPGPLLFGLAFVLSLCIGINQGVLGTYLNELFPTRIRAAAGGVCMNVGRIITAITVIFVGVLVKALGGYDTAIFVFSGAYVVGLVTLRFARETKGTDLPV
jgi:MFS family permease